jgi:predicted ATP-grasp superfamily ATP-dependent carboligase
VENRDIFLHAGGESFHDIPALNAEPQHIELLTEVVLSRLQHQKYMVSRQLNFHHMREKLHLNLPSCVRMTVYSKVVTTVSCNDME